MRRSLYALFASALLSAPLPLLAQSSPSAPRPIAAGPDAGFDATQDATRVAALNDLTWRAWRTEAFDHAAHTESVDLMRFGQAQVAASPDGISLYGPGLEEMVARGMLTREAIAAPGRPGFDVMVDRYRPMLAATPAHVWTVSSGSGAQDAFAAGRAWLRINLAAGGLGLALHPISQALQEYPAMAARYAEAHDLLGVARPARLQMLGRLGYLPTGAPAVAATPRWPAVSRIRTA